MYVIETLLETALGSQRGAALRCLRGSSWPRNASTIIGADLRSMRIESNRSRRSSSEVVFSPMPNRVSSAVSSMRLTTASAEASPQRAAGDGDSRRGSSALTTDRSPLTGSW